jgi:hypothetical protein
MPRGRPAAQAAQPQPSPVAANSEAASQPNAATRSSRPRIPPEDDGEFFDFENALDDGDDSEDQADASQVRHARSVPVPATSVSNIQVNDPTLAAPKSRTAALDIDYFYDRQKGRDTYCKECKQVIHFSHILSCYTYRQASPCCHVGYMAKWTNIYLLGIHFNFIPSSSSREISFRTVLEARSGKRLENPTARICISSPF